MYYLVYKQYVPHSFEYNCTEKIHLKSMWTKEEEEIAVKGILIA